MARLREQATAIVLCILIAPNGAETEKEGFLVLVPLESARTAAHRACEAGHFDRAVPRNSASWRTWGPNRAVVGPGAARPPTVSQNTGYEHPNCLLNAHAPGAARAGGGAAGSQYQRHVARRHRRAAGIAAVLVSPAALRPAVPPVPGACGAPVLHAAASPCDDHVGCSRRRLPASRRGRCTLSWQVARSPHTLVLAEEKVLSLLSRKRRGLRSVGKADRLFFVSFIDLPPQSGAVLPANGGGV